MGSAAFQTKEPKKTLSQFVHATFQKVTSLENVMRYVRGRTEKGGKGTPLGVPLSEFLIPLLWEIKNIRGEEKAYFKK